MVLGDTPNHLGDENRLANTGATEQSDLAAGDVRRKQVDDLDAGFEESLARLECGEIGGWTVNLPALNVVELRVVGVEAIAPNVPNVAKRAITHRHREATTGITHGSATRKTIGGLEADSAHPAVTELLRDFGKHRYRLAVDGYCELERRVQRRQRPRLKLDVDHGAGNSDHAAVLAIICRLGFCFGCHRWCP